MSTTTNTAAAFQPTCRRGHGPLRRSAQMTTGLWPNWLWICPQWRTCNVTAHEMYTPPARYGGDAQTSADARTVVPMPPGADSRGQGGS